MSDHPTAAFADQVRPGMRVGKTRPDELWPGPVTITQVRMVQFEDMTNVHLIGVYDDGSPFSYQVASHFAVLIHDAPLHEVSP